MNERLERIKQLFEQLDREGDGFLTHEKIQRRLVTRDHPKGAADMYAKELVSICDKSKDGTITFEEFTDFVEQKEAQLYTLFTQIGEPEEEITVKDLIQSFASAGIKVQEQEVVDFVQLVDTDSNGRISFEEWRDFLLLLPHSPSLKAVVQVMLSLDFNSDAVPVQERTQQYFKYFLSGGIAGAISRTVTAPLDRLKVLLQTQTYKTRIPSREVYMKAIAKIYKDGGILSFFRGNGLNVIKIFPESALKFFTFEYCKSFISPESDIGIGGRLMAGGMAGLVSQFAIYPIETVKTRIMAQIINKKTTTSLGYEFPNKEHSLVMTVRNLWKENGIFAFYRGCVPALVGIIPYAGVDLAVFETLKSMYLKASTQDRVPTYLILSFGMISGASGAVLMYPLSLVRTRLQAQGTPSHPTYYTSTFDVVQKTYAREGIHGFYKGLAPTLAKVLPAVSISYVVYEQMKHQFGIP
ncbi:mitochondrial carrier domain-containing protein [Gorgonomyces haynaldii]|nr:mitochondrial carrier domain-containing protein [Gorgonomyces haynaldii]